MLNNQQFNTGRGNAAAPFQHVWSVCPLSGVFLLNVQTTIQRIRQPLYKNLAHAIGAGTTNRTFNVPDEADNIIVTLAKRHGKSISDFVRETLADGIESKDKRAAREFRVLITKRAAGTVCLIILAASWLQAAITGNAIEFRRGRSVCVRVIRAGKFEFEGGEV